MSDFFNRLQKINFKRRNVRIFLIVLMSAASVFQIALFQNCGKPQTLGSTDSSSLSDNVSYAWKYGNWSTCSSPSCANQTRTATCMKTYNGIITIEPDSSLCGTQTQPTSQSCSVTVPACNVVPGTCQNSGDATCNTSTGRMVQKRMCSPSGAVCSGGCPDLDAGACPVTPPVGSCVNSGDPVCTNGRLIQARTCSPSGAVCSGGCASTDVGACTTPPPTSSNGSLFVAPVTSGTVEVTLYPQSAVTLNQSTNIAFGVPFPKGFVTDSSKIRVLNASGTEIPSFVTTTTNWRNFSTGAAESIKSVQIGIAMTFANKNAVTIKVQWGSSRSQNLTNTFTVASTWTSMANSGVNTSEYPGTINEPTVFATLPTSWMSQSLLKTRYLASGENATYKWFDDAFLKFSNYATASSTDYKTGNEPWLYDRAQTIFFQYFKTGDVNWLRRAHRAAQFYKNNITSSGTFALGGDAKYVYGQSMLYDLMLTGDTSLSTTIDNTKKPHASWTTNYSSSTNFWTERHSAYALLAVLSAFEANGAVADANRAKALFNNYFKMQQTPGNGWTKIGCPLHTHEQHDPEEDLPSVVCSPWMGALLTDAIWKYYQLSLDQNALVYLSDYADYLHNYALTGSSNSRNPYYGASNYGNTGKGDPEHACDVMGSMVKGLWAKQALGLSTTTALSEVNGTLAACKANLASYNSVSPPRKYNWWFGTNSDFSWMMENLP